MVFHPLVSVFDNDSNRLMLAMFFQNLHEHRLWFSSMDHEACSIFFPRSAHHSSFRTNITPANCCWPRCLCDIDANFGQTISVDLCLWGVLPPFRSWFQCALEWSSRSSLVVASISFEKSWVTANQFDILPLPYMNPYGTSNQMTQC